MRHPATVIFSALFKDFVMMRRGTWRKTEPPHPRGDGDFPVVQPSPPPKSFAIEKFFRNRNFVMNISCTLHTFFFLSGFILLLVEYEVLREIECTTRLISDWMHIYIYTYVSFLFLDLRYWRIRLGTAMCNALILIVGAAKYCFAESRGGNCVS